MRTTLIPLAHRHIRRSAQVAAARAELELIRDELAAALRQDGWDDEESFRVLVCADEAMANALSHGSGTGGRIDVRFAVSERRALVIVGDARGTASELRMPAGPPPDSSEHGRGLILMHALADRFRVWRRPAGTLVALAVFSDSHRATKGAAR